MGLPWWMSGNESACQYRRQQVHPWVGKIPEEGNETHFSMLAREIPQTEEPGGLQSTGLEKSQIQLSY